MDLSFTGLPDMDALPSFLQKIELRYRLGGGLESVLADAVSYTHLDVYKRQASFML